MRLQPRDKQTWSLRVKMRDYTKIKMQGKYICHAIAEYETDTLNQPQQKRIKIAKINMNPRLARANQVSSKKRTQAQQRWGYCAFVNLCVLAG